MNSQDSSRMFKSETTQTSGVNSSKTVFPALPLALWASAVFLVGSAIGVSGSGLTLATCGSGGATARGTSASEGFAFASFLVSG